LAESGHDLISSQLVGGNSVRATRGALRAVDNWAWAQAMVAMGLLNLLCAAVQG
jgi:hypothetical protein